MKIPFVMGGLSVATLLAISSLAPRQEAAKKAPASGNEDRTALEKGYGTRINNGCAVPAPVRITRITRSASNFATNTGRINSSRYRRRARFKPKHR